ncbi:MAG: hypothetical protein ACR2OE_08480, partial [Thermomicrobiales bacterium]
MSIAQVSCVSPGMPFGDVGALPLMHSSIEKSYSRQPVIFINDEEERTDIVTRVVVTGMGAITPLGIGVDTFW